MGSWLVLDLRRDQCAVGLLTIAEQGPPTWLTEHVLTPYVSTSDRDARSVADLAFFRRRGEKLWKPAMRSVLSDPSLAGQDKLVALFEEPVERLSALLPVTLGMLLREALAQYPVPILALLDRPQVQEPLRQCFARVQREARLAVIESPGSALAGFALWDTREATVPRTGAQWFCDVAQHDRGRDSTGAAGAELQHVFRCYTWQRTHFVLRITSSAPPDAQSLSTWSSTLEIERVGAATYALLWREKLLDIQRVEIATLQQELAAQEGLLAQLKRVSEMQRGVRDGSLLGG